MQQALHELAVETRGQDLYEMTREVVAWVGRQRLATGLLTVFCRHTSASC